MRIVVCVKEVLDPNAVNNYVLAGNLKFAADGKTPEAAAVPRLINGFDEQAMEAALRLKDAGADCSIVAVSIGQDLKDLLKHCAALGADEIVAIDPGSIELDGQVIANLIAAYVKSSGGADLILCGRQASDDDQGVVPILIAEQLGMAVAPLARAVELNGSTTLKVTRATPDGDEVVEGQTPAVITVSNELGTPRFPSAKAKMAARKMAPTELAANSLLPADKLQPLVVLTKQFVPEVQGNCEFISGSPAEIAQQLLAKLRSEKII